MTISFRAGYNSFDKVQDILSSNTDWNEIQYIVFGSPDPSLHDKPFVERHQAIESLVGIQKNVKTVPFVKCTQKEEFDDFMEEVLARGGEGVVLHDATAPYKIGIASIMWKVKVIAFCCVIYLLTIYFVVATI